MRRAAAVVGETIVAAVCLVAAVEAAHAASMWKRRRQLRAKLHDWWLDEQWWGEQ